MRCRKNFVDLTPVERQRLADALNDAFSRGVIINLADEHEQHFDHGIHWGPAFLPWHRHFILRLEGELRQFDDRVSVSYWDWTRSDSRDIDVEPWKSFFGGRNNSGGRFDHWTYERRSHDDGQTLPDLNAVLGDLSAATFPAFRDLECGTHVPGHTWTGGTMGGGRSPEDPLFYLHHGNIDRLWAIWQLNNPTAEQYSLTDLGFCDQGNHAFVDLNSPMHGGATPASMLDHTALGYVYHPDELLRAAAEARGMAGFIAGDPLEVALETAQVVFNDVPEGDTTHRTAMFRISGCGNLMFQAAITAGPFTLADPSPYSYPGSDFPTDEFRIWVQYTGTAPGTTDNGSMSVVAHNAFGDEIWRDDDVPIVANSVRRPSVAVTLVLDESGSMLYDAGNNRMRLEVLQLAATTFIDQLYDDNGLAMVAFSDAAQTIRGLEAAGSLTSPVRNDARLKISQHGPPNNQPHTCIGAGIQEAANLIAAAPNAGDFDIKATIVFTDGVEDRDPRIADVQHLITDRFYAVGVGNADNTRNDILRAIAQGTGGLMLVTGALAQDDEFLMEKFFIQVLVGVLNRDIVRDPAGSIGFGEIGRMDFSIARSDIAFDAVVLTRWPQFLAIALQAPDGTVIGITELPQGSYRPGATSRSLRVTLPVLHDGKEHWEGEWKLLLALYGRSDAAVLTHAMGSAGLPGQSPRLNYHALVHARSNLNMRATISQSGVAPGSTLYLRAVLTEYGRPLATHPTVNATVTLPDHSTLLLALHETAPGVFEASMVATQNGAYRFHLVAEGRASRGEAFTREHLLSAVIGRAAQPGDHGPGHDGGSGPGSGDDGFKDLLCCLLSDDVLTDRFAEMAKRLGIDIDHLRRCARRFCKDQKPPPPVIR